MGSVEPFWATGGVFITQMITETSDNLASVVRYNLSRWGLSETAHIELLTISENATFLVEDHEERRVVRVYRPNYHSDAEITSELLWLQAIEQSAIVTVPHLFTTLSGELFISSNNFRLACFCFMDGHEPKIDSNLAHWFFELGKISAGLHRQSLSWHKPENFVRKHWTYETMVGPNAYWGDWRCAYGLSDDDRKVLEACDAALKSVTAHFPHDDINYGLIHGDLRLANLLVNGDHLTAIDFDDCGFSWRGLDLANSLSFIEDDPSVPELIEGWFQGYQEVMPVTLFMRETIAHFIMMRRMQLTAWLASHANVPTAQKLGKSFAKGTVKLAQKYLMM